MTSESRFIDGPAGRIDSRWHGPVDGPPTLLIHPHPYHGGSMGTRLIYDLAKSLAAAGRRVVRFDFRGVGRSDGAYDDGIGETADANVMFDALHAEAGKPVTVIGFSFGGAIATRLAADERTRHLICIATPNTIRDSDIHVAHDAGAVSCPVDLIYGDHDELVPREEAETMAAGFTDPHWHIIGGADHFLTPTHLPRAIEAVHRCLADA